MIQRVQSLFLVLASGTLLLTFVLPVATVETTGTHFEFTNYGWMKPEGILVKSMPLYIGVAAIVGLLLATILMFKNRKRQVLMCRTAYLLILVQFALYFFLPDRTSDALLAKGNINQESGFFLPLLSIGFVFLAERFIRRDEDLIKSADRLR